MGSASKPRLLLIGQTPPPWHGQAVATQILFDHDWSDFDVDRIRMDFSEDMVEVGRFQIKKIQRLFRLIRRTRKSLRESSENILFYPPSSANWVPFIRDVIFLLCVRKLAKRIVFIFHASGLAQFTQRHWITRWLAHHAYHGADMALEVAEEKISPHEVFNSKSHRWCPCGIEAPPMPHRPAFRADMPLSVLFVGSLQEGKGILEVLRTAAHLKCSGHESDFHFNLVGRWMDENFMQQAMSLYHQLQLEDMVTFSGQLTGDDKWHAYHGSDVFFFPTHYPTEASPIVLMEALAAGLPIVTTQWNGIPALLEGCSTSKLLPIHSPDAYADALIEVRNNLIKGLQSSTNSHDFYQSRFTPTRFIERVHAALHAMI